MSERRDDGPLAPRRTLQGGGGPVLPPPSPQQDEEQRKAAEAQAAKEAREEQRRAEKDASRREREAKAEERRTAKESARLEKQRKAEQDRVAREKADREKADRETADRGKDQQSAAPAAAAGAAGAAGAAAGSSSTTAGKRPARGAKPASKSAGRARTRKARLRLTQIDAWSVMKTSFLLSIALGIVLVVAVAIVWAVLGAAGVWDSINSIVQQSVGNASGPQFDVTDYVGTSRVLGFTMIVAVVDVILITAIATLGAFLYNLSAALLGGIEVTLAEDS
ncbi:DUF3566 domain-containing protein [Nocardioides aurantiacus]|uniref:DUF3566 domain-containing protein n=1 Tax=Nocardioides aurantiacus TaxID=86796 RepID=UPI00403F5633